MALIQAGTMASEALQNPAQGDSKRSSLKTHLSSFESKSEGRTQRCDQHGEYISSRSNYVHPDGIKWTSWTGCHECAELERLGDLERKREKDRIESERRNKQTLGFSTIPKRFVCKTFENWHADTEEMRRVKSTCQRYAENFGAVLKRGACMVLSGSVGTGKTHLAAAMVNSLTTDGYSAQYVSIVSAVKAIKQSWRDPEISEKQIMRRLETCDLLVLDEIGVQYGSDTEKLIMFEIVNARYEDMKPTVLVSNLSPADLRDYVGARVYDRLREGGGPVLAFGWESKRGDL